MWGGGGPFGQNEITKYAENFSQKVSWRYLLFYFRSESQSCYSLNATRTQYCNIACTSTATWPQAYCNVTATWRCWLFERKVAFMLLLSSHTWYIQPSANFEKPRLEWIQYVQNQPFPVPQLLWRFGKRQYVVPLYEISPVFLNSNPSTDTAFCGRVRT
jgi:hypothetical protein